MILVTCVVIMFILFIIIWERIHDILFKRYIGNAEEAIFLLV